MDLLLPSLLLLLCFPLLLLLKILAKQIGDGRKNLPPGPWSLPIIGNLHQMGSMPHRSFLSLSQKHGPLMFLRLGSIPALVVSSGDALKTIFKSHDLIFSGRPVFQALKKLSFNNSNISFATYGENWRRARKLCVTELLNSKRVRSFRSVREEEVAMLSAAIKKLSALTSSSINLSEMVFALSYNVMCRTVFGDQHGGGAEAYYGQRNWFREVMAETQSIVTGIWVADFFPGWDWIDGITGQHARLEKNFEAVSGIYDRVIEEHLRKGKEEDDGEHRKEDLVDVLLRLHGDGGFPDTINYVKGIMADMLFGGTDSTSATIIWTMTELMKNQRVMTKLKQELKDVVGDKSKVEETDLEQLRYLKLVIREALRLHPPAPLLIPRETLEPCKIEGYNIPNKTLVFINAFAIARDPKTWKNHDQFWPERFDLVGVDLKGQDFNYVPFGVGRRICPGGDFGGVIMELALANLLHCFEWCLPDGMKHQDIDMEEARGIVMHKKVPLCLIAKPNN